MCVGVSLRLSDGLCALSLHVCVPLSCFVSLVSVCLCLCPSLRIRFRARDRGRASEHVHTYIPQYVRYTRVHTSIYARTNLTRTYLNTCAIRTHSHTLILTRTHTHTCVCVHYPPPTPPHTPILNSNDVDLHAPRGNWAISLPSDDNKLRSFCFPDQLAQRTPVLFPLTPLLIFLPPSFPHSVFLPCFPYNPPSTHPP